MKKERAALIERLFQSNVDNVEVVRGIFDLARAETDIPIGRRVRDLAAESSPMRGRGLKSDPFSLPEDEKRKHPLFAKCGKVWVFSLNVMKSLNRKNTNL